MTKDKIIILDFGSQYTQLIARRVRENHVFSIIAPYNIKIEEIKKISPKGIILSGGPASVFQTKSPLPDKDILKLHIPILGICYGIQVIAHMLGGKVRQTKKREYGKTELFIDDHQDIFYNLPANITSWMSHGDYISSLPKGFKSIAHTLSSPIAAIKNKSTLRLPRPKERGLLRVDTERHFLPRPKGRGLSAVEVSTLIFGVQFHPEVIHTSHGSQIISNFLFRVCKCSGRWTMSSFIKQTIREIKEKVGNDCIVCGLSGGVDSSVTAVLIHRAIGRNLRCIFIDNGLLRRDEPEQVRKTFRSYFHISLDYVDAQRRFLKALKGVTDPEEKRKIIGREFIRIFEERSTKIKNVRYLAQGTLYPDVIESSSPIGAPSAKIKSHHNVGGLPRDLKLKLIEPLRNLFKDEVRQIGNELNIPDSIIWRQPFPGPGLAIRIVGEVTKERLELLRQVDQIVLDEIKKAGLYENIWQSFAVLLPIKSVGVMGDSRTYENVIALRCVTSIDGMTADWAKLPPELLENLSNRIINEVNGVNRVVYDISSKPPATIEWE